MAIDYKAPGVTIQEVTEASIAPLLATPDTPCIIGPVAGYTTISKQVQLNGTLPAQLINSADGTLTSTPIISVFDTAPGSTDSEYDSSVGYQNGSYTIDSVNGTISRKTFNSISGISVTTTAGSTTATLSTTTGLTINKTYSITSNTILAANDITFTTGASLSNTVTLSSGAGVTSGANIPASINLQITVTTTAATAAATLSSATGLAANTTYSIYTANGKIPQSAGITFSTGASPSTSITLSSSTGVLAGVSTSVILNPVYTGLTVTTTVGSTSATLSAVTGLAANTTYSISTGSTIPAASKITFTTASSPVVGITLSSSTGVTTGSTIASTITSPLIPDAATATVIFKYVPVNYWNARLWYDLPSIEARFGNRYDINQQNVSSPVTLAAQIAFENGATEIVIQPLFYKVTSTGIIQQPTSDQIINDGDANGSTWTASLVALRSADNIGTIVPVVGQSSTYNFGDSPTNSPLSDTAQLNIFKAIQNHIAYQQVQNNEWIIGILGEDGTDTTNTYASRDTVKTHVATLQSLNSGAYNQQVVLVAPSKFTRMTPNGNILNLGGQYMAAAISGMLVSRNVSSTLTRKNVIGFVSVNDTRSKSEKTNDSKSGLFVVEQKGNNLVQIRHAITTDLTSVAKSELSVVRAKHKVINSLQLTIDSQIIGSVVADNNAPLVVASAIGGVLTTMVDDGDIVGFSDIQAKTLTIDPTVIEVRFSYRPSFPVNYIQISFSIDLTTGTLNLSSTNSGALNG